MNTITGLIPIIYRALDVVSREHVGLLRAVTINAAADQAAVGQNIVFPVTQPTAAADIVAAATGPDPSAITIPNLSLSIAKSRSVAFFWTGEQQKALTGQYDAILQNLFAQAMRVIGNEVEADLALLYRAASRAVGTAGQAPFGSTLADAAQVRRILVDNGAPTTDMQLVVNTIAGANLRTLPHLSQVNTAGGDDTLRRGTLLDVYGMSIRESGQIAPHTIGGGADYQINANHAAGATSIALKTGTGTVLAGDILAIANDPNRYVVTTGITAPGTAVIAAPGLLKPAANNAAVALTAAFTPNLAFDRGAIHALIRTPAMPAGGDAAQDVTVVTDPVSGISFQIAMYRQRRRVAFEVGLAWGVGVTKPAHIAILMG